MRARPSRYARLLRLLEQHQIVRYHVADVQVDDPVHQVEADEADREHDAGILVDIRRRDTWRNRTIYALSCLDTGSGCDRSGF